MVPEAVLREPFFIGLCFNPCVNPSSLRFLMLDPVEKILPAVHHEGNFIARTETKVG